MRAFTEAQRVERAAEARVAQHLARLRATPLAPVRVLGADDVRRALHCDLPFFTEARD